MEQEVVWAGWRRTALIILLFSCAIFAQKTFAAGVTLAWDASPDASVVGYKVYYGGASGSYTNAIDVGNVTMTSVSGLVPGATYYFVVTAYDSSGLESLPSNEVSYSVPGNQAPTLDALANVVINEDSSSQTVNLSGITSGSPTEIQTLTVTATSSNPGLIPNPTVNYISPNTTGTLTFAPVAGANGSAVITVTVNDGQPANNTISRTFTVTVNSINDPPTLNPLGDLTVNEDSAQQSVSLSGISSGAINESQTLSVTASSSSTGLIPTPTITYSSPGATGTLKFTPVANANGTATITVTVNDGAPNNNTVSQSFTVTVNPVNDPPTLNAIGNLSVNEGAGLQTVNLSGITAGPANESQPLTITASSSSPGLIPDPTVNYSSPNTTGSLTFTPVPGANGIATITVTVNDGQAANNTTTRTFTVSVSAVNNPPTLDPLSNVAIDEDSGQQSVSLSGITTGATNESQTLSVTASSSSTGLIPTPTITYSSPGATGTLKFTPVANANGTATITVTVNDGAPNNNTVSQSFTVTVNPVNDPPTLNAIGNLSVNEGAGLQTVNLSGITAGPANESQPLTITASSSNPGLIPNPTVNYASPSATGSLTFTPVAGANGIATITVTVNDGQAANNTTTRTFTVSVNAINSPPTLNLLNNLTILEDAAQQNVNLSGITSGATNESQVLTVTASSSNTGLIPTPTINYTSPNATGTLTFAPTANANGSATITVTVDDGAPNNSTFSRIFTVTVNPVNDPPTLNPVNDLTIDEDSGLQTVNLSGITSGAANESQSLSVTASSSNTGVVPTPTVTYTSPSTTGTLKFTPVANAFGTATITVTVKDGQATSNNVVRTFTVTVNPVNDPPKLNGLSNLTLKEDAPMQTVNLAGISSGSGSEGQTVTVTATSSNPGLIPDPAVNYINPNTTGTLTFTPVPNGFGTAAISVTVSDGQASTNRTFTVTVVSVNDPPTLDPLGDMIVSSSAGQQIVDLTGISSGAANEIQTLTVTATSSNAGPIPLIPTPVIMYTSPNNAGTLKFTPAANAIGSSLITVTVRDSSTSNNIISRAFNVTLIAGPSISAIGDQTIATNSTAGPLAFTIGSAQTPAANLTLTASSSNPTLIPPGSIIFGGSESNRTVTLTPTADQSGTATITITVNDGFATASTAFQLSVLVPPPSPTNLLIVTTNGIGSVTPNPATMQTLTTYKAYTLTAVPGAGQTFVGWSGSISSSNPKLTFVSTSNIVLHATFVPNPFTPIAGAYNGLFYEADEVRLPSSGFFTVNVTTRGTYSGRLQVGTARYAFKGQLDVQCQASNFIVRKLASPLILNLRVGTNSEADRIFGTLSDGTWTASLLGDRAVFNFLTNPAPYAGTYTMLIPGDIADASIPAGHGYGTLKVDAAGKLRFIGSLADGTKISQSAAVSKQGSWPFYAALYSGKGSVLSWQQFENRVNDDFHGTLNWIKQTNLTARFYRAGFTNQYEAVGSRYVPPPLGANILGLTSGEVTFAGGNLGAGFVNVVTLYPGSKVLNTSGNALSMAFVLPSGLFKGKVTDPASGLSFPFSGAVLPKMNGGYGYLLGTNQSSQVLFGP